MPSPESSPPLPKLTDTPTYWDDKLAAEGMPAELPYNIAFTPNLAEAVRQAVDTLRHEFGDEPTNVEVADVLGTEERNIVRQFGERVTLDREEEHAIPDKERPVEDRVISAFGPTLDETLETLTQTLDTIRERDAGIITMYFGLNGEKQHTLREISNVYRITPERVRQVRQRGLETLSKYMSPTIYLDNKPLPSESPKPYQKVTNGDSVFDDLPGTNVSADPENTLPYFTRFEEANKTETEKWLEEKTNNIDLLGIYGLEPEKEAIAEEIAAYHKTRERVINRPLGKSPESRQARTVSIMALDRKIRALKTYQEILSQHKVRKPYFFTNDDLYD